LLHHAVVDDRNEPIRVIAGLGNPGNEHQNDRHNAGFWFLDHLERRLGSGSQPEARFFGDLGRVRLGESGALWLLKPSTYMNRSGEAIGALCSYYRIAPAQLLVVHDELDLMPGTARLKFGGGSAGHNGLKDISNRLGGADFWRLRLGIGHPRSLGLREEVASFVLHRPSAEHLKLIEDEIDRAIDVLHLLASGAFRSAAQALRRPRQLSEEEGDLAGPPSWGRPPAQEQPPSRGRPPAQEQPPSRGRQAAPEEPP
jgi:PTH1 family peptidyl-tRNA hydrolase